MNNYFFVTITSKQIETNSDLLIRYSFSKDIKLVLANDKYNSLKNTENSIIHCHHDFENEQQKLVNLCLYNLDFTTSKTIMNEIQVPDTYHILIDKKQLLKKYYYLRLRIGSFTFMHKVKIKKNTSGYLGAKNR